LHHGLARSGDRESRVEPVHDHVDHGTFHARGFLERGVEDLEVLVAGPALDDPRERRELLVGLAVDERVTPSSLVVDRSRPPQGPRDRRPGQADVAVAALFDHVTEECLTVPLRGAGNASEVASTARIAVAEFEPRSLQLPHAAFLLGDGPSPTSRPRV
jgi:hypothetical protein